jgi:hypothetical protein
LNKVIGGMGYPLPNIQSMIERVGAMKPKFFAKLDMSAGYHQAPLSVECQKATAFITPLGKYEWLRVPMGLKVSWIFPGDDVQSTRRVRTGFCRAVSR